jgi:hypothetical protein
LRIATALAAAEEEEGNNGPERPEDSDVKADAEKEKR